MPSFKHEILVDLFRKNAALAAELLRACAGITVDYARIERDSIDLSRLAPAGFYADAVAVLRDGDNRAITSVIVEVQRKVDPHKLLTWPVYVATLRAQLACGALLLVLAPRRKVAAWARRPIDLGHPGFCLTPIVIGFDDVPHVSDRDAASRLPELAVLSAIAHPELEIANTAIAAIAQLPDDRVRLYLDVIMKALPAAVRQALEDRMIKGYKYQSEFARRYYGQGREEGLQEGLQEGRAEGRQEGRAEGLRAAAVTLARTKLGALSNAEIAAIKAVSDPGVLSRLIASLGKAPTTTKARAVLARARAR